MPIQRVLDISEGTAMVVSDIHGDWDIYRRYRDEFLQQRERGNMQIWILTGDIIHNDYTEYDHSMEILSDLIRLQKTYGSSIIIPILGNHELPHIYGIFLMRGDMDCTSYWERNWAKLDPEAGQAIMAFLKAMPLYIRTKAGVMLSHAGADANATLLYAMRILSNLDHNAILDKANAALEHYGREKFVEEYRQTLMLDYAKAAQFFFGATGPQDPRYYYLARSRLLNQDKRYQLLWSVLFTYNEKHFENENQYTKILQQFLQLWSKESPYPQKWIVAGHIAAPAGFEVICGQHLRIASFTHAIPTNEGKYLVFDCGNPNITMSHLVEKLRPLSDLL